MLDSANDQIYDGYMLHNFDVYTHDVGASTYINDSPVE